MENQGKQVLAIKKTIVHRSFFIPLEYHVLRKVEFDLKNGKIIGMFSSYFNEEACEAGAVEFDYVRVEAAGQEFDFTDTLALFVNDENSEFNGGEVI